MTIPEAALRNALDCLEKFANHPDTAAIHDPIYALLNDGGRPEQEALERALASHVSHPASVELRAVLGPHVQLAEPSLATVLERFAPVVESSDLNREVERRLQQHEQLNRRLRQDKEELERALLRAKQSSNAIGALGAFGVLFALVGWAIALGILEVHWMDSPMPSQPLDAAQGRGTPDAAQLRPKP